jgi:hypothetical protein
MAQPLTQRRRQRFLRALREGNSFAAAARMASQPGLVAPQVSFRALMRRDVKFAAQVAVARAAAQEP